MPIVLMMMRPCPLVELVRRVLLHRGQHCIPGYAPLGHQDVANLTLPLLNEPPGPTPPRRCLRYASHPPLPTHKPYSLNNNNSKACEVK